MRKNLLTIFSGILITATSMSPIKAQTVSNYDWINNARIFIVDGYTYPFTPKLEFNAEKLAEAMADMNANVLRIATAGYCDWLIPGTEFKTSVHLGNRDILAESISACKPRGIKVVPYLRTSGPIRLAIMKPEWAQRTTPDGKINSFNDFGLEASATCWNTPYRQAFYDYVKVIMSKYDVDGIYFDAWLPFYSFQGPVCYCEGCKNGFKKVSGKDLPYRPNSREYTPEEQNIIDLYRTWYREQVAEVFVETKRIVKSYKDIPLIYNINNPSRIINENATVLNGSDAFLYERGRSMIERAEGVSLVTARGMAVWPYVGTFDPFPRIPHYNFELMQEIFTSVAFGGSPILYHTYFFAEHPESRGPVKDAFKILVQNDEYIRGFRSEPFCAVVWNNFDPPGHEVKAMNWSNNTRLNSLGAFTACMNSHIQTTSLLPRDLENPEILNKYKVLYLADVCYLSDRQVTNIKNFVERGGGLVMSYATSLYNENGEKRSDFALGEVAKIKYRQPDKQLRETITLHQTYGGVWDLYLKTRPKQEVLKPPLAGVLLPTHLYETVEVLPGGTVIADQVSGTDQTPIVPGLVISRYGKGKVVYMASASDGMYYQTSIKELADIIKSIIEYVSPAGFPYEIEAPQSSLITNMSVKGNTSVFHLVNWTGSKDERILQNVYYIPPVENVSIKYKIPEGKRLKGIRLFVPAEFTHKTIGNIVQINIQKLDKYQGVVVEME